MVPKPATEGTAAQKAATTRTTADAVRFWAARAAPGLRAIQPFARAVLPPLSTGVIPRRWSARRLRLRSAKRTTALYKLSPRSACGTQLSALRVPCATPVWSRYARPSAVDRCARLSATLANAGPGMVPRVTHDFDMVRWISPLTPAYTLS